MTTAFQLDFQLILAGKRSLDHEQTVDRNLNKRLTACNSVDDDRLNGVRADKSLYGQAMPINTNFGESLLTTATADENSCTTNLHSSVSSHIALCMTFRIFSLMNSVL